MEHPAPGHQSESERPVTEQPIDYICADCRRTFSAPPDAPKQMDGLAVDGLTCPWCGRWAMPAHGDMPLGFSATRPAMRRGVAWIGAVILACLVGVLGYLAWMEWGGEREGGAEDPGAVAAAVKGATVSLQGGIASAEREGTPLSAKFEAEDEALQLSIYVLGGTALSEMFLDPQTGSVVKVETITGGDDLRAARAQAEVMSKATVPLRAAVERGLKASEGSRAISVVPRFRHGHPVAEITLVKETSVMTVSESLDQ